MSGRAAALKAFLQHHGWAGAERRRLADDASFRCYDRLSRNGAPAVLMDAPPPQEDVRPFLRVARHLSGLGYSAPAILAADEDHGFLLLEDLGDDTFTRVLDSGGDAAALYGLAVDLLIDLHRRAPETVLFDGLPPYDRDMLMTEVDLLLDWYLPAVSGRTVSPVERQRWHAAWTPLIDTVMAAPRTLVLRDFHVDNLMHLPDRPGLAACGLLDFQGAVAGPAAYDLMSLLEDARRDVDPELAQSLLARYVTMTGQSQRDDFMTVYHILAAQRHAKVIGIFTRLDVRDGKKDYLRHIPRVWRLLEAALAHPPLAELERWLNTVIPADERTIPA